MQHILLIDNFDSFTFNLVQLFRESSVANRLTIVTNDVQASQLPLDVDKVIISPGPGLPHESGNLMDLLAHFSGKLPVFGICLGHQAIALHFGARLRQLPHSFHGQDSAALLSSVPEPLFNGLESGFICGRYHSWDIDPTSLPDELLVTASDADRRIMAIRHKTLDVRGVQFHPESVMTTHGQLMLDNWLRH
ncbi:MAG: aminodeoxychorismate/anthranilate synthase component II [Bacteroidales bacterium]|nr:aminodeoxychorismate/anthranilate synthase component II [Bacteroidales bacterium]